VAHAARHGATWNRVPLSLHEKTIGDYLRPAGIRVALAGKTHVIPDIEGLERYAVNLRYSRDFRESAAGAHPTQSRPDNRSLPTQADRPSLARRILSIRWQSWQAPNGRWPKGHDALTGGQHSSVLMSGLH